MRCAGIERQREVVKTFKSFSIVVPIFNEEANIDTLVRRCADSCMPLEMPFELILVDDGSSDASQTHIRQAAEAHPGSVVGILLNRNYGQHAAVMAGFEEAKGDVVVVIDADLQNPPEEIPKLLEKIDEGLDVVGTVRVPRCDNGLRRLGSFLTNKIAQRATGVLMHDYGCMLRAYRRHIVQAMLACHERSTFIPILANSFARTTDEIEVRHESRAAGDSKYGLWRLINLHFDLVTSITTAPLRILSVAGAAISILGIALALYLLIMRLVHGPEWAVSGVFTLFDLLFVFVGAQFIGMGLMGEYIGRIYHDVRARPRYFVQQVVGGSSLERKAS
jgi:undecaprenyl-phosphate 4-deoxy-4-formamido-L-arabinose transferase